MAAEQQASQAIPMTPEQFAETLAQSQAKAMKQALRPENERAPGVSVFNPQGERDHPKDELTCAMFWVGFPLDKETLLPEELRLMNLLAAQTEAHGGKSYKVTRADGDLMKVEVEGDTNAEGKLRRLMVNFPCKDSMRHNLPSMTAMLREMLGELSSVEAQQRQEIQRLRKELESVKK